MAPRKTDDATSEEDDDPDCPRLPPQELLPFEVLLKPKRWAVELGKLDEIAALLFVHSDLKTEERNARITRALELYEGLKPRSAAEGMLAEQMVGTHFAALECLRRAALAEQTFEGRDMALKHAARLMKLYAEQLAALDKHRGKGQQKVTVEHVHVHSGGQAIVGNVESGASPAPSAPSAPVVPSAASAPAAPSAPAALENTPEPPVDFDDRRAVERPRRAKGK